MHSLATELVRGSVDLHTHSHPEVGLDVPKRMEDWDWAIHARDMGMRAIVLKSQLWPTMASAYNLQRVVPDIPIFSSITLNPVAGGVDPWVVEAAARLGARVVHMPTWSTAHDLRTQGFSSRLKKWYPSLAGLTPDKGITIVDGEGKLLPNAAAVVAMTHALNLVLFSGHVSPDESVALAEEAGRIGFRKLIFTHPHLKSISATMDDIRRMAERGAFIEICATALMPQHRVDPQLLAAVVRECGPERCVLTTDYFAHSCPPAPEMLRMLIANLLDLGISADAIRIMAHQNPCGMLGLDQEREVTQ